MEDARDVRLGGQRAELERLRDLVVAPAQRDEPEHLVLARRQLVDPGNGRGRGALWGRAWWGGFRRRLMPAPRTAPPPPPPGTGVSFPPKAHPVAPIPAGRRSLQACCFDLARQ